MKAPALNEELPVVVGVTLETFDGVWLSMSPTLTTPRFSMAVASNTVVGVAVMKSVVRLMREPVTVTSSRGWGGSLVVVVVVVVPGAVCANAGGAQVRDAVSMPSIPAVPKTQEATGPRESGTVRAEPSIAATA